MSGNLYFIFLFLDCTFFFVKRTSIGPISDQICLQDCEKILKAKLTNSDDNLWSLGNTIYRSFLSGSSRANRATKGRFGLSIRTPLTSVTGQFGPISRFDLSDTQRVASVPTVVSAFSRRPFTRTHQTLLFGFF